MKCIFCNIPSLDSKSVEHVIPESLGNTTYVLEKGVVCDGCNNYFARKIEQPLLEMPFFKQLRHKLNIESKKGRIPSKKGFIIDPDVAEVIFTKDKEKGVGIEMPDENVRKRISRRKKIPVFTVEFGLFDTRNAIISKFLAKAGIEGLACDVVRFNGNIDEVVNQEAFDSVKRYCRYAKTNEFWPYTLRQIKFPTQEGTDSSSGSLREVIFHYTFIYTDTSHFFYQLYLSGVELTIDMVNPTTDHVMNWQKNNPSKCEALEKAFMGQASK